MTRATHWAHGAGKVRKGPRKEHLVLGAQGGVPSPHPFGGGSDQSPDPAAEIQGKLFWHLFCFFVATVFTVAFLSSCCLCLVVY